MVVSRHPEVIAGIRRLRAFGVDRPHSQRGVQGMYDVPTLGLNYRMTEIQAAIGRVQVTKLPEILARRRASFERLRDRLAGAAGIRVLESLDPRATGSHYCLSVVLASPRHEQRDQVATGLVLASTRLDDPAFLRRAPPAAAGAATPLLRAPRGSPAADWEEASGYDMAAAVLAAAGIGTSVYYPHPVPRLTYYRYRYGYDDSRYPAAENVSDASVALPVAPHVSEADVDYIADTFKTIISELAK